MPQWPCLNGSATRANVCSTESEPGQYGANSELAISLVATEIGEGVERLHTRINLSIDFQAWKTLQPLATAKISLVVLAIGGTLNNLQLLTGFLAKQLFLLMAVGAPIGRVHHGTACGEMVCQCD